MYNNNQFSNQFNNGLRGNMVQPSYYSAYPTPQYNPFPQTTNTNKIFVSGIDDVKNRYQPPNSDYLYLDNDKPVVYQKTVDYKGQFEVKEFDIVEKNAQISTKEQNDTTAPTYVEKAEFDRITSEIEQLKQQLSKIKGGGSVNVGTNANGNSRA